MSKSIELFTGVGGLALGLARAGYDHVALIEYDKNACTSIRGNIRHLGGKRCRLYEGDIRSVDLSVYRDEVDLLAAGAPCQPFSIGGKHRAHSDERNLFPDVFRSVLQVRPKAVLVENVKGLLRSTFAEYVEYIELQLAFPEVVAKEALDPEAWRGHLPKLRRVLKSGRRPNAELVYRVRKALLNASDFGVPQRRERVFFVAIRRDLGRAWMPPSATHTEAALRYEQLVDGSYWGEHNLPRKRPLTPRERAVAARLASEIRPLLGQRWRTVRDALAGLPEPINGEESAEFSNHLGQPGARSYPGHTGSPMDEPAKTLKAGVHGVPGGENMLRRPNGKVRYFTVREAARLQGIPDDYLVSGAWGEAMRQLGNAVPVQLAAAVATSILRITRSARAAASAASNEPLVAA